MAVVRYVGVYDADGTVRGELAYFLKARIGKAHCALCDVTHGLVSRKQTWKDAKATLDAPFDVFHRDDQPATVRAAAGDVVPVVVAEHADGSIVVLLGPEELDACGGSPDALVAAIRAAVASTPSS